MDTAAWLTALSFAVPIVAGVAPVRWPQHTWIAGVIFWLSLVFALVCSAWWILSNQETVMVIIRSGYSVAALLVALGVLVAWMQWRTPATLPAAKGAPDNASQPRPVFDNSSTGTTDISGATFNGTPPPGFVKNEGTFSGKNMTVNAPQNKPLVFFSWTDETRSLPPTELISRLNVVAKELRERNNAQDWIASAHRGRDLVGAAVVHKGVKLDNVGNGGMAISLVHIPNRAIASEAADFLNTIAAALAAKK